jgi:hypothetical protein
VEIAVRLGPPPAAAPADVEYRWDTDTDILTATVRANSVSEGMSGSVGVEGADGSWLMFDVSAGHIRGIEVAVWPQVQKRSGLQPPAETEHASVTIPTRLSQPGIASLEVDTALSAESDHDERTIHFRIGRARSGRAVRIARDIVLDVADGGRLTGVWLLNVPPFPDAQ